MTKRIRKFKFENELPAPNSDIATSFCTTRSDDVVTARQAASTAWADASMKRGGEVVAAQGLPDVRVWPKVLIITTGIVGFNLRNTVSTSDVLQGSPVVMVRFSCWGRVVVGLRTSAVTVWPLFSVSSRTNWPVLPVAPIRKICGSMMGCVLLSRGIDGIVDMWLLVCLGCLTGWWY